MATKGRVSAGPNRAYNGTGHRVFGRRMGMSTAMELPKNPTSRTAFLFDLDGTLVDSVYQHVLAWHEAMAAVGIELAVWTHPSPHRHERRADGQRDPPRDRPRGHTRGGRPLAAAARRGLRPAGRARSARCPARASCSPTCPQAGVPWAIATSGRLESARPTLETLGVPAEVPIVTRDQVGARQARPRPVPRGRRAAPGSDRRLAWWWATASGTCWPPGGPGRLAWVCSRAATDRRNSNGPARIGSTRTLPTCCGTSTRSGSVPRSDAGQPGQ